MKTFIKVDNWVVPVVQIVKVTRHGEGRSATGLISMYGVPDPVRAYVEGVQAAWDHLKTEAGFLEIELEDGVALLNPIWIGLQVTEDGGKVTLPLGQGVKTYPVTRREADKVAAALRELTDDLSRPRLKLVD